MEKCVGGAPCLAERVLAGGSDESEPTLEALDTPSKKEVQLVGVVASELVSDERL